MFVVFVELNEQDNWAEEPEFYGNDEVRKG